MSDDLIGQVAKATAALAHKANRLDTLEAQARASGYESLEAWVGVMVGTAKPKRVDSYTIEHIRAHRAAFGSDLLVAKQAVQAGWRPGASALAARSEVPEGFVLVPVEPTTEMIGAGRAAIPAGHGQAWLFAPDCYRAMLAARPGVSVGMASPSATPPFPSLANEPASRPRFGDIVENGWASERNPTRVGYFVREGRRTGKMNPGRYYKVTDGDGLFWELPLDRDHKITVRPAGSRHPVTSDGEVQRSETTEPNPQPNGREG